MESAVISPVDIPTDLIIKIFSRLPAKSVVRFRVLSKQWWSILHRPYFTELFLTTSRAHPRLLFALTASNELTMIDKWSVYSSPQSLEEKPRATFHTKFEMLVSDCCGLTSGLLLFNCFLESNIKGDYSDEIFHLIFNPNTGQNVILPRVNIGIDNSRSFLGFDPIDRQYKVLLVGYKPSDNCHNILTLGSGSKWFGYGERWRKIQCPFTHEPCLKFHRKGICINGVVYYLARNLDERFLAIVCFDVRSETYKYIVAKCCTIYDELVNYKGKLGGIWFDEHYVDGKPKCYLSVWVLQDAEKQEWTRYKSPLWDVTNKFNPGDFTVAGVTPTGEIVLSDKVAYNKTLDVYYYNPERNSLQYVEIQGVGPNSSRGVDAFVGHVEDLNAYDVEEFTEKKKKRHGITKFKPIRK